MISRLRRIDPGIFVAALLPLIGILPMFGDAIHYGVINTADGPLHVHRIQAMSLLLGEGVLWPRWVPWFHLGFGYPIFNFYPPGVFYLGGLLGQLGVTATTAFTLIAALTWIIGSVGMYRLARRALPAYAALLAAMLWTYAPSRLFEVWDQGSLPQMMASALVPWWFDGIIAASDRPTKRNILAIALPMAGILFSHQPISFIAALYAGPLALIAPWWFTRKDRTTLLRRYLHVFAGFLLGAGLAGIFLIPLATELRYVQASRGAEDNVSYLVSNFLQPNEIFAQLSRADLTDLRFELPTTLGLIGGLLAIPGLIALARRKQYGLLAILLVGLGFTLFMLVEPSLPVWLSIPFFRQLRFPERFLRVGVIFIALAGGASILLLPRRLHIIGMIAGLVIVLVAALPMIYPNQRFLPWENLTASDEIDFELTTYTWGTTSYDEFDPIWGEDIPLPTNVPEQEEYATDPTRLVVYRVDMARYADIMQVDEVDSHTSRIQLTEPHAVRFQQYDYPGWTATLDGEPVEIKPDDEFGLITVNVPEGEHLIRLNYDGTLNQSLGAAVTLASVIIAVALAATSEKRSAEATEVTNRMRGRTALGVGVGIIWIALVNTYLITPGTLWFRQRSPADAPAAMQAPVQANFGDTFTLLGYTLDQQEVAPGGLFDITLFWRAQTPIERAYRPVVQLVNLTTTEAWGASEPFFPGGGITIGYPTDRFASEVDELRVFEDAPPYPARVSVQMLDAETSEPLRLPDSSDRLLLDPLVWITGTGKPTADQLGVTFGETAALRCANVIRDGDTYSVDLGWHTLNPTVEDVVTFIHALDAEGNLISQADGPPFGGNYPSSLWRAGQSLRDGYTLAYDDAITEFEVGLYTPDDTTRLSATQNGQPVADNAIRIPVAGAPCEP